MGGFLGWFVVFVGVLAIFNAEKLPELRTLLEEKLKISFDAAKEGSKRAKVKIKQVKTDIENKKSASVAASDLEEEENTPEEIEESLKFMGNYINGTAANSASDDEVERKVAELKKEAEEEALAKLNQAKNSDNNSTEEEQPIDLEKRY